jgi:hypothetical protein
VWVRRHWPGDLGPQYVRPVTEEELFERLAGLRRATVGNSYEWTPGQKVIKP